MPATTPIRPLTGFGTINGVPWLPDGFADVFDSTLVRVGEVELHTVQGGAGRPLLLVGGWSQNWYVWRFVMPRLTEHFRVVAVEPRGVGRSDKLHGGYDTGTVAAELAALMRELGLDRFAVTGHDIGMWLGYALAADHADAVERLALLDATTPDSRPTFPSSAPRHRTTCCGTSPSTASGPSTNCSSAAASTSTTATSSASRPPARCRTPRSTLRRNDRPRPRGTMRQLRLLPGHGRQHRSEQPAQAASTHHAGPRRRRSLRTRRTTRCPPRPRDRAPQQRHHPRLRDYVPEEGPGALLDHLLAFLGL